MLIILASMFHEIRCHVVKFLCMYRINAFFNSNTNSMIEEIYHPWPPNIHCAKNPEIMVSVIYNELCSCLNTITHTGQGQM